MIFCLFVCLVHVLETLTLTLVWVWATAFYYGAEASGFVIRWRTILVDVF